MIRLSVDCDLTECGVENALEALGGYTPPHIMVGTAWRLEAIRICSRFGWSWEVDSQLSGDEWKVRLNGKTMYSPGA